MSGANGFDARRRLEAESRVRELWAIVGRLDQALFDPAPPEFPLGCPYSRAGAAWSDLKALREELGHLEELV
jgi:hypothetical protein